MEACNTSCCTCMLNPKVCFACVCSNKQEQKMKSNVDGVALSLRIIITTCSFLIFKFKQ